MSEAQEDPEPLRQPPAEVPLGGHENPRGSVRLCEGRTRPQMTKETRAPPKGRQRGTQGPSRPHGGSGRLSGRCVRVYAYARAYRRAGDKEVFNPQHITPLRALVPQAQGTSLRSCTRGAEPAGRTARLVRACAHAHAYVRTRVRLRARTMRAARAYVCARTRAHAYMGGLLKSSPHVLHS